tara:strand:- start:27 stop:866 length:840 start_codon:yes stop_codon:yes gene_type:complete
MIVVKKDIVYNRSSNRPILIDIFYKQDLKAKDVIVFSHGFKGFKDWGAFNQIANFFAEKGFVFIKFNFSHNGTTISKPLDFVDLDAFGNNNFSIELNDLDDVINWIYDCNWLRNEINLSKVSLLGHSRGGGISIIKASEDKRITNIISWSSPSNFVKLIDNDKANNWKEDGVIYIYNGRTNQQMPMFYQFYIDVITNKDRFNILKASSSIDIPMLIVHGSKDPTVPIDDAITINLSNPKSQLSIINDADHVFGVSHPYSNDELPMHLKEVLKITHEFLK